MDRFLKDHGPVVVALGAGLMLGAGGTVIYYRITGNWEREVRQMHLKIDRLCQDVKLLRTTIENVAQIRRAKRGYYSVHASSGEDDDDYEEALEDQAFRRDFEQLHTATSSATVMNKSSVIGNTPLTNKPSAIGNTLKTTPLGGTIKPSSLGFNTRNGNFTATDLSSVFSRVDKLLDGDDSNRKQAYNILVGQHAKNKKNPELLWRLAKATTFMAQIEGAKGNEEEKKSLTYVALTHAKAALDVDAKNASVHKWYAITLGNKGDYEGTAAKIENGYVFKKHIERAIQLNPRDPSSHYLLGRWCFGVYMLSWLERKAAATLYATPPTSTVEEAMQHFFKADQLSPGKWKDNMLYIAKCFIEKRDYGEALHWLDRANSVPVVGQDDRDAQTEIDKLLYKYSGYRY